MTNVTSPISNPEYSTLPAHSPFLVTVFGGARVASDTRTFADSVELGRLLAEAGFVVATGGYTGTMEAVLRGAREAGAHTVGYTCATFERDFQPNPWVMEERKSRVLSTRIQRLAEESDAFVVVHGGLGTLAELALVWNMLLAGELPAKPLVVVGPEWPKVIDVVHAETQMGPSALRLLTLVETGERAVEELVALLAAPRR
ncbi:MAG TPA: LOG family protein [Anaerolineae bacterium]|nr:LOG family protein [Anaerolineae bacterium]